MSRPFLNYKLNDSIVKTYSTKKKKILKLKAQIFNLRILFPHRETVLVNNFCKYCARSLEMCTRWLLHFLLDSLNPDFSKKKSSDVLLQKA